jgi:hypothetical protein
LLRGGPITAPPDYPGPFDVCDISTANVQISRDSDGNPMMKFEMDGTSRRVAIIGITPEF